MKLKVGLLFGLIGFLTLFSYSVLAADAEGGYTYNLNDYEQITGEKIVDFKEAPILAGKVKSGEIPSVEGRLPENPVVIKPFENNGEYGGSITLGARAPDAPEPASQVIREYMLMMDPETLETLPNVAEKWEYSNDGRTFTLHLRKGLKWSDGEPLTADDMMFWYNAVIKNEELTPVIPNWLKSEDKNVTLEKIDKYTVSFNLPVANPNFHLYFNGTGASGTMAMTGPLPAHFLKKFHIEYNSNADELAKEADYDHWYQLFEDKNDPSNTVDLPTIYPWILSKETPTGLIFERNPYYFKVDTAGNQLPYIDTIRGIYFKDNEVFKMKILNGEINFDNWGLTTSDWPLIKTNEKEGGYNSWLAQNVWGSACAYYINQNYPDDPVLADIFRNPKFRQALSLAINRTEINDSIALGQGVPRQATFHPNVPGYKDEWAEAYASYDPEKANQLLDEIGLKDSDGNGWRERRDGKELNVNIQVTDHMAYWPDITELVKSYWQDIGIKVNMRVKDNSLLFQTMQAGQHQITTWVLDNVTHSVFIRFKGGFFNPTHWGQMFWAPEWGTWLNADGEEGVEPPQKIKELYNLCSELGFLSIEEQSATFEKIGDLQADNLWSIGTIGMMPMPVIANKDLGNVSQDMPPAVTDFGQMKTVLMEQFYWKSEENR